MTSLSPLEAQKTRKLSWESDFEKNHETFARKLAKGIVKDALDNLTLAIENADRKPVSSKNKLSFQVCLNITIKDATEQIKDSISNSQSVTCSSTKIAKSIAHFDEWLTAFSSMDEQALGQVEESYFTNFMSKITCLVKTKFEELLLSYQSRPEYQTLRFEIKCCDPDPSICSNSATEPLHLEISLWLQEKEAPNEVIIDIEDPETSSLIKQYKAEYKKQHDRLNRIGVLAFVILFAVLLFSKRITNFVATALNGPKEEDSDGSML